MGMGNVMMLTPHQAANLDSINMEKMRETA